MNTSAAIIISPHSLDFSRDKSYIEGRADLDSLFKSRGYEFDFLEDYWERKYKNALIRIYISDDLFDNEGNLKYMKAADWNEDYFKVERIDLAEDDGLPF